MAVLLGIPILVLTVVLQTTAFSRLPLLHGTADIVLLVLLAWMLNEQVKHGWEWVLIAGLMVSFVSALPLFVPLWSYFLVTGLAYWLKRRIWQTPALAMLVSTFFGTIVFQMISLVVLRLTGSTIPYTESFNLVILPSVLLNLILAIPVYTVIGEFAAWIYPGEVNA